jgi:uncharacterized membrane protein YozB (DUF420 family)
MMEYLPTLNAALNTVTSILLIRGFSAIRRRDRETHRRWMLAALTGSALFLTSYLIYHVNVGSVPYPHYDWTRPLYFAILIPHVLLAGVMTPFILTGVVWALRNRFDRHRKLMRWVWPVWMFVSVSGVVIYLMLYRI